MTMMLFFTFILQPATGQNVFSKKGISTKWPENPIEDLCRKFECSSSIRLHPTRQIYNLLREKPGTSLMENILLFYIFFCRIHISINSGLHKNPRRSYAVLFVMFLCCWLPILFSSTLSNAIFSLPFHLERNEVCLTKSKKFYIYILYNICLLFICYEKVDECPLNIMAR